MNIASFRKNDVVVRIEATKEVEGVNYRDRGYIGEKLILIGVANGCAYLKKDEIQGLINFGDRMLTLPLDMWDEGWQLWIDPEALDKEPDIEL